MNSCNNCFIVASVWVTLRFSAGQIITLDLLVYTFLYTVKLVILYCTDQKDSHRYTDLCTVIGI